MEHEENAMLFAPVTLALPGWIRECCGDPRRAYPDAEERLRLAVELARRNVEHDTGGPFGAAVFDLSSFRLVAAGVNRVIPESCSVAHAEIMAIMLAQKRLGTFDLRSAGDFELATSAEPCAMCYGALPWSGIRRLAYGATREDVQSIGFDEGDKPADWARALEARGIEVVHALLRPEAREALEQYRRRDGAIY
jgi:tRNA(Arg) A34 adenosine deaminase TadA